MSYRSYVLSLSPAAYWRLGESSGSTAVDEIGAYPGTYVASPTLGVAGALAGDTNTGVTFNGTTQYVSSIPAAVIPTTAGTISAWVKRSRTLTNETVFGGSSAETGVAALGFHSAADNYIRLTKINTASLFRSSAAIADTNWHHVVGTWDGTAGGRHMYIDGVEGTVVGAPVDCATATATAAIGAYGNGTTFFGGSVDEVAVWPRALTAAEVAGVYREGVQRWSRALQRIKQTRTW